MLIKKTEFVASAAGAEGFILSGLPQFAVVGKSNVGKSSLINFLANDSKLARTSKEPGRTRLVNYFLFNEAFFLTDLPGYGYASVSKNEKEKWAVLMEDYFQKAENLVGVLFLLDIRHDPSEEDLVMYNFLFRTGLPFFLIATKCDKLSKRQLQERFRALALGLKVGTGNILGVSSLEKTGKEAVLQKLEQLLAAFENLPQEI